MLLLEVATLKMEQANSNVSYTAPKLSRLDSHSGKEGRRDRELNPVHAPSRDNGAQWNVHVRGSQLG